MQNNLYTSNSKLKKLFKLLVIIIVAALLLGYVNNVLQFKYGDGITVLDTFYELEENSVDVLVLGSSHSFEDINPAVLYEEQGMASFVLAASAQPIWNTYYYLKEALKTQTPELIVLECYCTVHTWDYGKPSHIIKSTYGMKWSEDKWNAMKVSIEEDEFFSYFPQFLQYHNRYEDLSSADFLPYQGRESYYKSWKGHGDNMLTEAFENPIFVEPTQGIEMLEKIETYYRMIIELAQSQNIPLCVVVSPCADLDSEAQGRLYTAKKIAEEYGVVFKDFNYCADEMGLDYAQDFADPVHLNYKGNEKYTSYLGGFLKDNFQISDRRGNSEYSSWQDNVEVRNHNIANYELKQISNSDEYEDSLKQLIELGNYYIICTSSEPDSYGEHRAVYNGNEVLYDSDKIGGDLILELSKWNTLYLDGSASIKINNKEHSMLETGQNIVVYDKLLECVVDTVAIEPDNKNLLR